MFCAIAAASMDKYEWYKYTGKKTLAFENHHTKYDLDLEPSTIFGLRMYAGTYRLITRSDPNIVFKMSGAEVKKLQRLSEGWSGTVNGMKLRSGKQTTSDSLPSIYPDFVAPASKATIQRLYNTFSKKYFWSECPEKITIRFPAAIKTLGTAGVRFSGNEVKFILSLSKNTLLSRKQTVDTIIHEMIHLLHYKRHYVDGKAEYLNAMHGPLFVKEMDRLNKIGFDINIVSHDLIDDIMEEPSHILLIELDKNRQIVISSRKDFQSKVPALLDQVRAKIHSKVQFTRYRYGTTTSTLPMAYGIQLTNKLEFPKSRNIKALLNSSKLVGKIENSLHVVDEKALDTKAEGVRSSVANGIAMSNQFIILPFDHFLLAVMEHAGLLDRLPDKSQLMAVANKTLNSAEIEFARKAWEAVKDHHFLASVEFASMRKRILKADLNATDSIRFLAHTYDPESYEHRVPPERYAKLCLEAFGDIIVEDDTVLRKTLIKEIKKLLA